MHTCVQEGCTFTCKDSKLYASHLLSHQQHCHVCDTPVLQSRNWERHKRSIKHKNALRCISNEQNNTLEQPLQGMSVKLTHA